MNRSRWYHALTISCCFFLSAIGAERASGGGFFSWFAGESEPQRIGKQLTEAINTDLHKIRVIADGTLVPGSTTPVRPRPELYKKDVSAFVGMYKGLEPKHRVLPTWKVNAYRDAYNRYVREYVSSGRITEKLSRLKETFEQAAQQLLESVNSLFNL